jgi:hypothetical protein
LKLLITFLLFSGISYGQINKKFNNLKDCEGLELSHLPGVYEEDITIRLKVPEGGKVELITSNKFRSVASTKMTIQNTMKARKNQVQKFNLNQKEIYLIF